MTVSDGSFEKALEALNDANMAMEIGQEAKARIKLKEARALLREDLSLFRQPATPRNFVRVLILVYGGLTICDDEFIRQMSTWAVKREYYWVLAVIGHERPKYP